MRMVSRHFNGKNLLIASISIVACATAFALSPAFAGIKSALSGLKNSNVECSQYENDKEKKQKCDKCKKEVDNQKKSVDSKEKAAESKDQALESKAVAGGNAGVVKATLGSGSAAKPTFQGDQANKAAGKDAKTGQASNFADLAKALDQCKDKIKDACEGIPEGDPASQSCEAAAKQAQAASGQAASDAERMAKDEKKNEEGGKGMEMPKMPEMPKPEAKPDSSISSNTNTATNTATKVADSALSGNQFGSNKVGIGGTDDKPTAQSTALPSFHNGGAFDSGISSNKGFEPTGGAIAGTQNGSGASSMGSSMGGIGGGGGSDSGAATTAAALAVPAKTDDIEAFSNGGARPSYLGMKSKGGELADLGLEVPPPAADMAPDGSDGDRSLASTDQNAGIHTEENSGSLFNMIRERLREVGRRGSI